SQDKDRYVIAVNRDESGRGGSRFIHDDLSVGDTLQVLPPKNMFELNESAENSLLIAGGIGITPLFAMIQRLNELKRSWRLVYCARSPGQAAFMDQINAMTGSAAHADCYFNEEPGYIAPDFAQVIQDSPADTHFYCCGPAPLM